MEISVSFLGIHTGTRLFILDSHRSFICCVDSSRQNLCVALLGFITFVSSYLVSQFPQSHYDMTKSHKLNIIYLKILLSLTFAFLSSKGLGQEKNVILKAFNRYFLYTNWWFWNFLLPCLVLSYTIYHSENPSAISIWKMHTESRLWSWKIILKGANNKQIFTHFLHFQWRMNTGEHWPIIYRRNLQGWFQSAFSELVSNFIEANTNI